MTHETKASRLPGDDADQRIQAARKWHSERAENQPSAEEDMMAQAVEQRRIKGNSAVLDAWREAKSKVGSTLPPNSTPAASSDTDPLDPYNIDKVLREFTLERDDNRPLRFQGYLVGFNEVNPDASRGTAIAVFVTRRDKIVTSVHQWQKDIKRERQRHAAAAHDTAEEALAWLIEDGRGHLGKASKEAWELACQVWPALQGYEVEVVE